jgi:hypothetical protein
MDIEANQCDKRLIERKIGNPPDIRLLFHS